MLANHEPERNEGAEPFDTTKLMRHARAQAVAYRAPTDCFGPGLALDEALILHFVARGWTRGEVRRAYKDADLLRYGFLLADAEGQRVLYCRPLSEGGAA